MTLAGLDRLVRGADGRPVVLDSFLTVYYDDETAATLDLIGPELPEPADDLVLLLLAERYPGVTFEPADEFRGFREADPEPDHIAHAR